MPEYRLYFIDVTRGITKPATVIDCPTDEDAVAVAEGHRAEHILEIWDGKRLVARIEPTSP